MIVPCFNHGEFVGEAVQSVLSQPGEAPEVIVIDDGSTEPATIAALDSLPAEVRLIRQPNAGRSAARNAGVAATDASFLLMLDSDDRLAAGVLPAMRQALIDDESAGFAYGRLRYFGAWSKEIAFPGFDPFKAMHRSIAWMGLVRREAFEAAGGFDPELEGYEDWDLILGMIEAGWGAAQLDEVVLEYRRHEGSSLESDRRDYRRHYRRLRAKHAALFARSAELGKASGMSGLERWTYRTFWAWRPIPARVERTIYARLFS